MWPFNVSGADIVDTSDADRAPYDHQTAGRYLKPNGPSLETHGLRAEPGKGDIFDRIH